MPGIRPVELSVEDAAVLLHVQPATVRRRIARKELRTARRVGGGEMVRFAPADDWIRVEDASAILGVAPATVRANVRDGRLTGRREKSGRWRVSLRSVLEDRRCDRDALALFGGDPVEEPPAARPPRLPHQLHRAVYVRLRDEEVEVLERGRDRHGSIQAAVVAGLRAIDDDQAGDVDVAALRVDRDTYEQQLGRVRAAHRNLSARARERMVDELWCPVCEAFVPIEETGQAELEDGTVEVFHEKHGHRSGSRFRSNTVIARRARISLDPVE